jgi:hypothetical protein
MINNQYQQPHGTASDFFNPGNNGVPNMMSESKYDDIRSQATGISKLVVDQYSNI